ncbi:hypothetical protein Srot_1362 [Segniliparus rotundus DSM 44985]|uniref:FG-GAP repeat protein n=1 Tax=Segniliparus rotundus (strain ATCC BAA-972 / CDC 1076 / CIP 108378 / DSM 44985 / JCM 13578) TaxID=640132 RepID=D6Z796_SEGRD|nr:hypothetical protein [Segniliparus rotundus]ADG97826.1 hypothetical protein Srot_1362 [Segniliparus rotundus DSM 44985]
MGILRLVGFVLPFAAVSCSAPSAPAEHLSDCESVRDPQDSGVCGLRAAGGMRFEARWASMVGHSAKSDPDGKWHIHIEIKVFGRDGVKRQAIRQEGLNPPFFALKDLDGDGRDELLISTFEEDGETMAEVWRSDGGKAYADVGRVAAAVRPTAKNGIFVSQIHAGAPQSDLLFAKFQGSKIVQLATVPAPRENEQCHAQANLGETGMAEEEAREYFCAEAARLR